MIQSDSIVETFKENGWLLKKKVFETQEIERFRQIALNLKKEGYDGDLLAHKETREILFDNRVLQTVRSLLGTNEIVYFGDSSCVLDDGMTGTGFHKDNPDKKNANGPDWQEEYPIIRMGIYLQNHDKYSAALALKDKSHRTNDLSVGKSLYVNNEPGDLSIWYLTTTHAGYTKRLKLLPRTFVPLILYRFIPEFMFLPEEKHRISFFMTFGKKGPLLDRYLTYLKTRKYMVKSWKNSEYDITAHDFAKQKGVELLNMNEEVRGVDLSTLNDFHVELPF